MTTATDGTEKNDPPLAGLVLAGDGQIGATAITGFVFMAKDISNAYLVTTDDGDVMVNTGFPDNAARNVAALAPHRTGPMRAIILTQSHGDHFGGLDAFREDGTQVIAQERFVANMDDMLFLQPHFGPRSRKLWGSTVKRPAAPPPLPRVAPDVLVDRVHAFTVGGRRFELIATPDGETTDALSVWLPDDRILFTGNLFGPVFESMPFLCTIRGDKPRSVRSYLASLDRVRGLGAEILVTGHGDPIRGAETIRAALDRMHAAVSYIRDETLAGMNAGKDIHALMREIALPDHLRIGEYHGKVSWAVRTIRDEYAGWFDGRSTTELYGVPRSAVDDDLVRLAGGADALAAAATKRLEADEPLAALHLIDIALGGEPGDRAALTAKKAVLARLLERSGAANLSETMWLRSEIAVVDAALAG